MICSGLLRLLLYFLFLLCFNSDLSVLSEGPYCNQGSHGPPDIIENGVMNSKYMWYKRGHKTYVPVVMDHSYSYKEHSVIVGGLQEISQKTCVEFDIYDNEAEVEEKDYVHITKNTKRGCYSYIGRIGGKQEIGLPIGCISHRTAMHEMLHALGFRHEHVRYDRDDYIIVFWGNIRPGRESNFKKRSPSDLVSGPYDYDSIMHYERKAFSVNGMETIRPLKPGAKIGIRQEMSYWDAQKVNVVYKCGDSYSNSPEGDDELSHSPVLLRYNEDHDHNDTLPIAEYDDFNSNSVNDQGAPGRPIRPIRPPPPPRPQNHFQHYPGPQGGSDRGGGGHFDNPGPEGSHRSGGGGGGGNFDQDQNELYDQNEDNDEEYDGNSDTDGDRNSNRHFHHRGNRHGQTQNGGGGGNGDYLDNNDNHQQQFLNSHNHNHNDQQPQQFHDVGDYDF